MCTQQLCTFTYVFYGIHCTGMYIIVIYFTCIYCTDMYFRGI